jgi:23S rRNA (guanosine2251-2'-O)-methyltransferase
LVDCVLLASFTILTVLVLIFQINLALTSPCGYVTMWSRNRITPSVPRGTMVVYGVNPVLEALTSRRQRVREIWVGRGKADARLGQIVSLAESQSIPVRWVDRAHLDSATHNAAHQGIAGVLTRFRYFELPEILRQSVGTPLLIVLDGVQDPRNLGAIVRTADACGAWGVCIPKDRAAQITGAVAKASAGAVFHVPIIRVTNVSATLNALKQSDLWVAGASGESPLSIFDQDLTIPLALVIGGEGHGIRPLVRRHCDMLLSVPMKGSLDSLNASVATAVMLYEVFRQRRVMASEDVHETREPT